MSAFRRSLGEAVFLGHLDGAELGRAVASADILLNPSTTEVFGNVNLEAMAAGLAVISADVGSAQDLIEDGLTGYLRESRANVLAETIEHIMEEPWLASRVRKAAVSSASEHQWVRVMDSVVSAYHSLLASPSGGPKARRTFERSFGGPQVR